MNTTMLTVTKNDGTTDQWIRPEDPIDLYRVAQKAVEQGKLKAFSIISLESHIMLDDL